MREFSLKAVLACAAAAWLTLGATLVGAGAGDAVSASTPDATALRELLEGRSGRRESWKALPDLVIVSAVLEYNEAGVDAGYVATDETLDPSEIETLTTDLTRSLQTLTAGQQSTFRSVRTLTVVPGERTKLFQRGQIVVGRFRDLRGRTGTLGWGGRMTRGGDISSAGVMLDRDFDTDPRQRRLLRMHELAHALGYNHVESRASVMNPRVGSDFTDFDREAVRVAFPPAGMIASAAASISLR